MTEHCVVSKWVEFDAGHRVPLHASKCRNPHGHRYRVTANVRGPIIEQRSAQQGMVVDFGIIKSLLMEHVHDVYDHAFIVAESDDVMLTVFGTRMDTWNIVVVPFVPTAEELARDIYRSLVEPLSAMRLQLISIDVHETPTSCASYPR